MKKRVDVLLVERGLAESRAQAQALVLAGRVRGYDKPGTQVDEAASLEVEAPPRFVSRGGEKLANALEQLGVDPAGRDCLDVGASTGGFTDVLLQRGARRVIALDVGYGQLHLRLRDDPRVIVLERTNLADAGPHIPATERIDVLTADLSFISLSDALPQVRELPFDRGATLVALVKPQFELGLAGLPSDDARPERAFAVACDGAARAGWTPLAGMRSPVLGARGAREFFLLASWRSTAGGK
jgi:23S rRNA (cytidine1920-2'-O)/16S rRNA (cytidine1409-2'-O)-methyltransferase